MVSTGAVAAFAQAIDEARPGAAAPGAKSTQLEVPAPAPERKFSASQQFAVPRTHLPPPASNPVAPAIAAVLEHINVPGWQPIAGSPQDGDPDKVMMLKEYGCQSSLARSFQRGQRRINAVVYCFHSSQGAYGAYNLLRRGSSTVVAKGDASSEDDQSVSIWTDRFFISVSGTSEDDDESKEAVSKIANQLSAAITTHGELPQAIMRLPTMDRVHGSEKIVMGPASARKFFPAPSLVSLSFANSIGAGIADYVYQEPFRERMKLMVVNYVDSFAAQQAFEKYTSALEQQHPNVASGEPTGRGLYKMANSFLLCELRSQRILLISGARKKSAPLMLARQIY